MTGSEEPLLWVGNVLHPAQADQDYHTAIRKHVHGTHRRWNKSRRAHSSGAFRVLLIADYDEAEHESQRGQSTCRARPSRKDSSMGQATPRLSPPLGSIDPFETAAIKLTPRVCELLQQAEHFEVFRTWLTQFSRDAQRTMIDRNRHIGRLAIEHEAHMHGLLAAGACVLSDSLGALQHKTTAISILCRQLPDLLRTYYIVRLLISLEFFAGNLDAARIHHRAAVKIASSHAELEKNAIDPLTISDVWLAAHSFQRTDLRIADWDPGPRSSAGVESPEFGPVSCSELRELMAAAREVSLVLSQNKPAWPNDEAMWLSTRGAAVFGRLNNYLFDRLNCRKSSMCRDVSLAMAMAASCAMHFMFTRQSYSQRQRGWYDSYQYLLRHVDLPGDNALRLWLYFMCAVNEQLLGCSSRWAWQQVNEMQRSMKLSWAEVRDRLRQFVYAEVMEQVLRIDTIPVGELDSE